MNYMKQHIADGKVNKNKELSNKIWVGPNMQNPISKQVTPEQSSDITVANNRSTWFFSLKKKDLSTWKVQADILWAIPHNRKQIVQKNFEFIASWQILGQAL